MEPTDPLERAVRRRERGEVWTDEQFRAAREQDLTERTHGVWSVVAAVLGCLLLALLLTSGKLVEIAERQEFGAARDRNLDLANGVDRVANFLSLNRPYDAIQDLRDANNDRTEVVASPVTTTTTTVAPTTTAGPVVADNWPNWRGPQGNNVATGKGYPERTTFVIGTDGTITHVIRDVKPAEHMERALAAVR